jgi:hypothetical protein
MEDGFALYKEIEASNELGLSPYVYDIYQDIIKPALAGIVKDVNEGLSREEINKKYFQARHKALSNDRLKRVLMQLEAVGLIVQEPDRKDGLKMALEPPDAIDISPQEEEKKHRRGGASPAAEEILAQPPHRTSPRALYQFMNAEMDRLIVR